MTSIYCSKCENKQLILDVDIFNIINQIITKSKTIREIYNKINMIRISYDSWFELNDSGYNIFHWYAWFIATNIKKNAYLKPKVYAFFCKIFINENTKAIFSKEQIRQIINMGTLYDGNHTLLYHIVKHCENPNDIYYKKLYKLLLENGATELTNEQLIKIKQNNTEEISLPTTLKLNISNITNKYKLIEQSIIDTILLNKEYTFNRCFICKEIISYLDEIPTIIKYAKENNNKIIIDMIWEAYSQRKLINKIFDKYYQILNSKMDLNKIHNRHLHIIKLYESNLVLL